MTLGVELVSENIYHDQISASVRMPFSLIASQVDSDSSFSDWIIDVYPERSPLVLHTLSFDAVLSPRSVKWFFQSAYFNAN